MNIENPSSSISGSCFLSGTDYSKFLRDESKKGRPVKFSPPTLATAIFVFIPRAQKKRREKENKTKHNNLDVRLAGSICGAGDSFCSTVLVQSILSTRQVSTHSLSRPQEPNAGTRQLQNGLEQEYNSFPPIDQSTSEKSPKLSNYLNRHSLTLNL